MSEENTNWGQSVTGVVIKEGKVLLHVIHMEMEKAC